MSNINDKLIEIQSELKAPKGQFNSFGKYNYRNCEDILEAVKPLLKQHGLTIVIGDDIINIGNRFYVKATVTICDGENSVSTSAFAREEENKKGMDGSQVTGASSSYARKYALNGLFAIDDTKDSDTTNNGSSGGKQSAKGSEHQTEQKQYKCVSCGQEFKPFTTNGKEYTAGQAFHMAEKKYGRAICINCRKKEGLQ